MTLYSYGGTSILIPITVLLCRNCVDSNVDGILLPDDCSYAVLPLYHWSCGVAALRLMYRIGCTIVLRRKFSASNFFPDLVKYRCTVSYAINSIDLNINF